MYMYIGLIIQKDLYKLGINKIHASHTTNGVHVMVIELFNML